MARELSSKFNDAQHHIWNEISRKPLVPRMSRRHASLAKDVNALVFKQLRDPELRRAPCGAVFQMADRGFVRISGRAEALPFEPGEVVASGVEAETATVANHDTGGARVHFDDKGMGHGGTSLVVDSLGGAGTPA